MAFGKTEFTLESKPAMVAALMRLWRVLSILNSITLPVKLTVGAGVIRGDHVRVFVCSPEGSAISS